MNYGVARSTARSETTRGATSPEMPRGCQWRRGIRRGQELRVGQDEELLPGQCQSGECSLGVEDVNAWNLKTCNSLESAPLSWMKKCSTVMESLSREDSVTNKQSLEV